MDSGKAAEKTLKDIVLNSGYIKVAKDILADYYKIPLNKRNIFLEALKGLALKYGKKYLAKLGTNIILSEIEYRLVKTIYERLVKIYDNIYSIDNNIVYAVVSKYYEDYLMGTHLFEFNYDWSKFHKYTRVREKLFEEGKMKDIGMQRDRMKDFFNYYVEERVLFCLALGKNIDLLDLDTMRILFRAACLIFIRI